MDTLPLPTRANDESDLKCALKIRTHNGREAGYAVTQEELDDIIALYNIYDACGAHGYVTFDGGDLEENLADAIKASYGKTQKNGALNHIRFAVMETVERCPICGIAQADELDHFLPKEKFPVLAVYRRNLVPICHKCNQLKGSAIANEAAKCFIQAYFDELPERHLNGMVSLEEGALVIYYSVPEPEECHQEISERIANQLEKFRLNERWNMEVITYVSGLEAALEYASSSGGEAKVSEFLNLQAQKDEQRFGVSHWRPVLLRALANNVPFCGEGFRRVLALDKLPATEALSD